MESEKCLVCHKEETHWVSGCYECDKGLCETCYTKIRNEINTNIKRSSCEYCTKNHIISVVQNERKLQSKYTGNKKGELIDIEFVRKKYYFEECRCNENCNCIRNARIKVKGEYAISDFSLYEIYDDDTDYLVLRCTKCLDAQQHSKRNEGFLCTNLKDRYEPCF